MPARSASQARSALRVLRPSASLAKTDLLALDLARVASDESGFAQRLAQAFVVVHERARDAVTNRAGLPRRAAAANRDLHVETPLGFGDDERLANDHARRLAAEEHVEQPAVDDDVAVAGLQVNAGRRGLAPSGAVVDFDRHFFLELQRFRLLRGVRMLLAADDLELLEHLPTERALRQHAFDGNLDGALRVRLQQLLERLLLHVADRARVAVVDLVLELAARDADLLGIDDDDEVARVYVRGVDRLVLAAQPMSQRRGQTAESFSVGIDEVPIAPDGLRLRREGFHVP